MRASVLESINNPLVIKEIPNPETKPGVVSVRIKYAAVNHRDVFIQKGLYAGITTPAVLGSDGAGKLMGGDKIVLINPNLNWGSNERFQSKNYRVLGMPDNGTFADWVSVPWSNIHEAPAHLAIREAAALPLAGLTAYRALFKRGIPGNGDVILISGIGGGVALFALQFALAAGFEVYVTSGSDEKIEKAIALGAKGGFNYKNENWHKDAAATGFAFDVALDGAGGPDFNKLLTLAAPGARIAVYGGTCGKTDALSPQHLFWKQISIMGTTMGSDKDFADMLDFVKKYRIRPIIDSEFTLETLNEAFEHMHSGKQFGKITVKIS